MGAALISRKMVDFMWHNRLRDEQLPYWLGPFPSPGYGFNLLGRVMMDPGQAISLSGEAESGWGGAAATFRTQTVDASFARPFVAGGVTVGGAVASRWRGRFRAPATGLCVVTLEADRGAAARLLVDGATLNEFFVALLQGFIRL